MLLSSSSVSTSHVVDLKRQPLLQCQVQRLKPKPLSQLFFTPLSSRSSSPSSTVFAIFKSKTKATPAKKVLNFFLIFFFFVVSFWFETLFNYFFGVFIYRLRRQRFKLRMVFLEPQEASVSQSRMSSLLVVLL